MGVASAHAILVLHVADHGLDGGIATQFGAWWPGLRDSSDGREDPELVAATTGVGEDAVYSLPMVFPIFRTTIGRVWPS
ncbi:hypothetical protein BQ8482_760004 [Mesorhizobium delmotii]|uniref:Uncharacterized protein n=1 Tax=Mesorhizobium delmotii TaxID=1631247 RepID=A0A2P9AW80_9HYPH|nr:hypothetical protein BQ8482_760004 [Mesorhizobium delmotii]